MTIIGPRYLSVIWGVFCNNFADVEYPLLIEYGSGNMHGNDVVRPNVHSYPKDRELDEKTLSVKSTCIVFAVSHSGY